MTATPTLQHLDDAQLQGLADGSLRGPEGAVAREHCGGCAECQEAFETYQLLIGRLDALVDPPAPQDFTPQLFELIAAHDEQLAARRHISLAAIPAVLVAAFAMVGWGWSAAPGRHLDALMRDFTLCQQLFSVAEPALNSARLPLAAGALAACLAVGVLLVRALRVPAGGDPMVAR